MNRGVVWSWNPCRRNSFSKCSSEPTQSHSQCPLLTFRVSPQELEFQETLIAEREAEIREIESGIHELNDIFRDLGTIVEQQGGLIGQSLALTVLFGQPCCPANEGWLICR